MYLIRFLDDMIMNDSFDFSKGIKATITFFAPQPRTQYTQLPQELLPAFDTMQ